MIILLQVIANVLVISLPKTAVEPSGLPLVQPQGSLRSSDFPLSKAGGGCGQGRPVADRNARAQNGRGRLGHPLLRGKGPGPFSPDQWQPEAVSAQRYPACQLYSDRPETGAGAGGNRGTTRHSSRGADTERARLATHQPGDAIADRCEDSGA